MTKQDLIDSVASKTGFSKSQVKETLGRILDAVTGSLKKGESVTLTGFGTFATYKRKARAGRNPQTGATITIPAARVPKFKAGKALKDAVR